MLVTLPQRSADPSANHQSAPATDGLCGRAKLTAELQAQGATPWGSTPSILPASLSRIASAQISLRLSDSTCNAA